MKKSRKKMLLSSIAMLLVALVALGSATFAWYITQDTVTAKDAKFAASTAEGLVIKHARSDANWVQEISFNDGSASKLSPATTNYAAVLGNIVAGRGDGTSANDGTLKDGTLTKINDGINATTNFYVDHCYVASSADATNAYIKIEGTSQAGTYINVLVYAGTNLVGAYTSDPRANDTTKIKLDPSDDTKVVEDGSQGLTALGTGTNAIKVATPFTAETMNNQGTEITVVAFADGYNDKCTNTTADPSVIDLDISFKTSAWS